MVNRVYRGCSLRAIGVGFALVAFMSIAIPWGDMIIKGSQMGVWNTNPGSIFLFFVLLLTILLLLRFEIFKISGFLMSFEWFLLLISIGKSISSCSFNGI